MKLVLYTLLLLSFLISTSSQAGTCDFLEQELQKDPNVKYKKTLSAYTCGPHFQKTKGEIAAVDGCLIQYESEFTQGKFVQVAAFLDVANNLKVNWMIPDNNGKYSGWEYSGKVWCGDIKTYADFTLQSSDPQTVSVIRARAFDNTFCPGKIYSSFDTTCTLIK